MSGKVGGDMRQPVFGATFCTLTNVITYILERLFNLEAGVCKCGCADSRLSLLMKSSCAACFLESFLLRPLLDEKFRLHHASLYSVDTC